MAASTDDLIAAERAGVSGRTTAGEIAYAPITTTALTPQRWDGASFVSAQADVRENVASAVLLSDGIKIIAGRVFFSSHGFSVGSHLYLDQGAAGALTETEPTTGVVQRVGLVESSTVILISLQEGYDLSGLVDIQKTFPSVDEYADNATAIAGGLIAGDFYRTGGDLKVVI